MLRRMGKAAAMDGRILIVHAAVVMRMIVTQSLTSNGYDVVGEAESGGQALQQYRDLLPDIVTIDMVLPDMDGVAVVRAIIAQYPQARIIMCSSIGQPALLAEAIEAGARSFITKPFGPGKLIETIRGLKP